MAMPSLVNRQWLNHLAITPSLNTQWTNQPLVSNRPASYEDSLSSEEVLIHCYLRLMLLLTLTMALTSAITTQQRQQRQQQQQQCRDNSKDKYNNKQRYQ
eukprot:scaffold1502_cov198-Alexandrium_tamarense.AAC.3